MSKSFHRLRFAILILLALVAPVAVRAELITDTAILPMGLPNAANAPGTKALQTATAAIQRRDVEAARTALSALATSPDLVHPEILLADLLIAQGFAADGRATLERLSRTEVNRQDLYLMFCGIAVREGRWFDGWNLANIGERANPPANWSDAFATQVSRRIRQLKATCCEGRGDFQGALTIYSALERDDRTSSELMAGLARSHFHLGNLKESVNYFKNLHTILPTAAPPYLMIAQLYEQTGDMVKSEAAYRQALKDADRDDAPAIRLSLARWMLANNRPAEVNTLLANEIADSPDNERERQFLLALAARMEGRIDDARKSLTALHQKNPTVFAIGNHLALVLVQSEDETLRARALQLAEGNVRNNNQAAEAWATLGWVQFQLGDRAAAENSLGNATQSGQLSRDMVYYLAKIKEVAGDKTTAATLIEAFEKANGPNYFTLPKTK